MGKKKAIRRIKRGYDIDEDILQEFEKWTTENGLLKNSAVQLAVWVVQRLSPQTRYLCTELMNTRAGGRDLQFTIVEEQAAEIEQAREAIRQGVVSLSGPKKCRKVGS